LPRNRGNGWKRRKLRCPVCGEVIDWGSKLQYHAERHALDRGCALVDRAFNVWRLPDGRLVVGTGKTLLDALASLRPAFQEPPSSHLYTFTAR
jgi:hypothetical protein